MGQTCNATLSSPPTPERAVILGRQGTGREPSARATAPSIHGARARRAADATARAQHGHRPTHGGCLASKIKSSAAARA
eukprot:CAMPEP_0198491084 /NCGR_PEP_ID=MMETSP1462-20131121/2558_1 /TAXON_ID=1333877 /ORGANISM="Brandtodinium nutriculum, Strain RCC3387" /LENGTH=78 /DNA_ID=CAMNT_0044219671 /DNA_START=35 /DNA_END=269 /DNA_ORIENTATION=+